MRLLLALFLLAPLTVSAAEDTKAALATLKASMSKLGVPKVNGTDKAADKTVPALFFGSRKINNNFLQVDEVKKRHGGTATIFVKDGAEFVRISTNVLKDDGTRAVGTSLAHNAAYDAASKGQLFCGDVEILGAPYDTCYDPIKDASGTTIGIYYVGYKKN